MRWCSVVELAGKPSRQPEIRQVSRASWASLPQAQDPPGWLCARFPKAVVPSALWRRWPHCNGKSTFVLLDQHP